MHYKTVEEKAKAYDIAVEEIGKLRDMLIKEGVIEEDGVINENFERIFTELKEPDDEDIRVRLCSFINDIKGETLHQYLLTKDKVLAWLEKQGDKKSEEITINNYEYVDLGLPSGLKWCKTDVGAFREGDFGLYFAWGETVGYPDASSGKSFTWADYKFGKTNELSKYNSTHCKTVLDPEDDAATVNMGEGWRMPTEEEYKELRANTSMEWIENYKGTGHNVMKLTSKVNGNYIILPSSGFCFTGSVSNVGSNGFFWTSSLYNWDARIGRSFVADNIGRYTYGSYRAYGQSVRGVHV